MTLRKRTLLIIGLTLIGLIALLYTITSIILLDSFARLEEQDARQNVSRVQSALSDSLQTLNATAGDWAPWDDTYAFVEDGNEAFIQNNLVDSTFANLQLNLMLFIRPSGELVYGKAFDLEKQQEVPIPQGIQPHLATNAPLLRLPDTTSSVTGVILLPEGPMLVASRPILTSNDEGPIRGTLVMGRYLDGAEIESMAQMIHLSLAAYRFDDPQAPADVQAIRPSLSEESPVFIQPLSEASIAGYARLTDIYGKPALVLRVDMPRSIYQQGRASLSYLILALVVAALVFGAVTTLLLERQIVSRLTLLSQRVSSVGASGDLSARVAMAGRDELSRLADTINGMLSNLERAQHERRESEERYRNLVETSPDVIYNLAAKDGTLISLNPAFERVTGWPRAEWLGQPFADIVHPDDLPFATQTFQRICRGETPTPYELRVRSRSGEFLIVEVNSAPQVENRVVVGTHGIVRNITQRKQAEEALAAEKERLAVTLRSIGDGVITTDTEGKIVLINKVAEDLTGWTQAEAFGRPVDEVFHIINEKSRAVLANPVEKVLKTGRMVSLANHTLLVARDGTERVLADSAAPICDSHSKVVGVVLVFRDVTQQRKMEEDLLKSQKLESVGILAGGIAHDFNNILTTIIGNVTLAKIMYAREGDSICERLTAAEKAVLRAKDLTEQLLTFSKGGAPVKKTAAIADLIRDTANFAMRGSSTRHDCRISHDLWPVEVDEGQISQVVSNLLINANDAMPGGGTVFILAENTTLTDQHGLPLPDGKYVHVAVKDHGVGIPPDLISKIFDPYFTTKEAGSGLGLAISYSIVKNHGGHIAVESELGVGTTFHVYLPASERELPVKPTVTVKEIRPSGRGTILIMDDQSDVREIAGQLLKHLGYEVSSAKDGTEAVDLYRKAQEAGRPFDAVIMDLTIPGGMGGKEAIQKLLEIDPKVKAIVSSGYSTDPIMADFRKFGFSGVVSKPYEVEDLSAVLLEVLKPPAVSRST
jgi:PAS domain S-box-containing protein